MVRAASMGILHVCPTWAACSGSPGTAYVVMLLPVELRTRTSRRLGLSGMGALSTARTTSVPSVTAGACFSSTGAGVRQNLRAASTLIFHAWLGLAAISAFPLVGETATATCTPVGRTRVTMARLGEPATGAGTTLATVAEEAVHAAAIDPVVYMAVKKKRPLRHAYLAKLT